MTTLQKQVNEDVSDFLNGNSEVFFNERDFQMHLATYLKNKLEDGKPKYDDVDIEYYVPSKIFKSRYIWQTELKIDIVVSKCGKYCPIELKYKTKAVNNEPSFSRFGVGISKFNLEINDCRILKNQSAQDLGMYDFWKDVRRIELLKTAFDTVEGGLCVFLTNDGAYANKTNSTSNNFNMSMANGRHGTIRHWLDANSTCAKTHPDFVLDKSYDLNWNPVKIQGLEFQYVIATI